MSKFEQLLGRTCWVIPGGHIPFKSTGREPEFTSRDQIAILNIGDRPTKITSTIYYKDREPKGPYELTVRPRTVRHVMFNDLIFPEALPLDEDFAALIVSELPFVVQFTRLDSGAAIGTWLGTIAYALSE